MWRCAWHLKEHLAPNKTQTIFFFFVCIFIIIITSAILIFPWKWRINAEELIHIYQDNKKWSIREQIKVTGKGLLDKEKHEPK